MLAELLLLGYLFSQLKRSTIGATLSGMAVVSLAGKLT